MRPGSALAGNALTGAQLREAERGLVAMLRAKSFPAGWVRENAIDLLAQAASEYAAWLKNHEPEPNPVGWLLTCAYRRAQNLLDAQRSRPTTTPLDAAFDLADSAAPTPEQEVLANDRQRRLREALERLPRRDRRMLSLVYFEDRSVREAGRRLGWGKSVADRRHGEALGRLRAIVGEDRSLLSPPSLGLAAWVAATAERGSGLRGAGHSVLSAVQGAGAPVADLVRRFSDGVRRLLPLAEPGSAAASGGAGRVVGACGVGIAAAVCGLVAAGVEPPLPGGDDLLSRPARTAPAPSTAPEPTMAAPPTSTHSEDNGSSGSGTSTSRRTSEAARRAGRPAESAQSSEAVAEEFGIEHEPSAPTGAGEGASPAPSSSSPSNSYPRQASGAQVSEEFGL